MGLGHQIFMEKYAFPGEKSWKECAKRVASHAAGAENDDKRVNVEKKFYDAIRTNSLDKLHIPHSDVFYVRQAVEAHYGRPFTLKHVEDAMRAEGWKEPNEQ